MAKLIVGSLGIDTGSADLRDKIAFYSTKYNYSFKQRIFDPNHRTITQRRYLLDFVFQNIQLHGKTLVLPLKQPLKAIQKAHFEGGHLVWCRERDSNPRRLSQMIYSHPCLTASLSLHI